MSCGAQWLRIKFQCNIAAIGIEPSSTGWELRTLPLSYNAGLSCIHKSYGFRPVDLLRWLTSWPCYFVNILGSWICTVEIFNSHCHNIRPRSTKFPKTDNIFTATDEKEALNLDVLALYQTLSLALLLAFYVYLSGQLQGPVIMSLAITVTDLGNVCLLLSPWW